MRRIIATRLNTPLMLISEGRQSIVITPAIGRYYRSFTHNKNRATGSMVRQARAEKINDNNIICLPENKHLHFFFNLYL